MAVYTGIQAIFRYGNVVVTIPYIPSGAAVASGQVVLINNLIGIATHLIPDGILGALNIQGGVYECVGDAAIAAGKDVYWDNTNKKVTETRGLNKHIGVTISACSGDMGICDVAHIPSNIAELGS